MTKKTAAPTTNNTAEKVGTVGGMLTGGALGLGLCVMCPILPLIVGTIDITVGGITVGGALGNVVGQKVDEHNNKK